jgi:hypothetical protein
VEIIAQLSSVSPAYWVLASLVFLAELTVLILGSVFSRGNGPE